MQNPQLLARFDSIIKSLKGKRVGLLFDNDADGTTSAALAWNAIKRITGEDVVWASTQSERGGALGKDILKVLPNLKLDLLITLDKPLDQDPQRVKEAEQYCGAIIVVDHHTITGDLDSEKTCFIKAQFIADTPPASQYPTAKMTYDLFSRHVDLKDLDWVSAAGLIADASYIAWKPFVDEILIRNKWKIPKDIFDSRLADVSKLINNVLIYSRELGKDIFAELVKAKSVEEFLQSPLKKYSKTVEDEISFWLGEYEKAEFIDDLELVWYPFAPKFRIGSPVSTILSMQKFPQKTVIILTDMGGLDLNISLRRQDKKVDMAALAAYATKGLENANGGGHIPAAGASVMKKDLETFKERVLKYLGEHSVAHP